MSDNTIRPTNLNNNDADKTIRPQSPVSDADKTVRPQMPVGGGADKTVRPQMPVGGGADKTVRPQMPVGGGADKTVRPQMPLGGMSDKTQRVQQKEIQQMNAANEKEYVIDGKKYKFVKFLSQGTGEGDIMLVELGGNKYVLKLYYVGLELPNANILKEVKKTDGKVGLVGLLSYGKWKNPHSAEERCYELMQYCEGGSLAEYQVKGDENKFKKLAVMMAMCINACHEHGFLHCDIKPANFMFVDKAQTRLALCDFGISIVCDNKGSAKNMSDARTRIYAAPEFYFSVPGADGREIYKSSDFYSLGMSLLCLWMGESTFKQQEAELMKLKISGKLPYPPELSDHTLCLLRALTTVDAASRPEFKQIVEWAKGQNPFEQFSEKKKDIRSNFNIVFNAGKDQVAHSPEELAEFMYKDQTLAQKYLYSGKISKWLIDNLHPELEIEMEEIVEQKYQHDKQAGVYAACYVLDSAMPYYDLNGNPCTTEKEIASAIAHNRKAYQEALKNNGNLLYIFLKSQGLAQLASKVSSKLNDPKAKDEDRREAISQLIFTLDPSQPFIYESLKYDSNNDEIITPIECNTITEVVDAVREYTSSDDTWEDFTKPSFLLWVGHRDKSVVARIQQMLSGYSPDDSAYTYGVIYGLHRGMNFDLEWNQDQLYTYQHLAQYMNMMIDSRVNPDKYSEDDKESLDNFYDYLSDMKGSRLYFYLKSKGTYDKWIDWINYCYDTDSKDNKKKAAPYNMWIATYKCIKGMGIDPVYYTASGKQLTKPTDAKRLSKKEIHFEASSDRGLQDWLTVFYQEDPALDLSKKFTFEKKTVQYVEYLESLGAQYDEIKRHKQASKMVKGAMSKVKRKYRGAVTIRVLLALLCFVPLLVLIVTLCVVGLPFEGNPLEGHFWDFTWVAAVVLFIPICFLTGLGGKLIGEGIISAIIGAILYWIFWLLLKFLIPVAPYAIALLLLLFGVMIFVKCYIKLPLNRKLMKQLTDDSSFEQMELEPLHYAYRTDGSQPFESSVADDIEAYGIYLGQALKKLLLYSIPTMLLTAGLFYLMAFLTPQIVAKQTSANERASYMVGTWTGSFDGKKSTIDIKEASAEKVVAVVHVKFSTMSNEKVIGTINMRKNTMELKDQVKNNVLDGSYSCKFSDSSLSKMTGTYYNPKSGKRLNFEYERPLSKKELELGQQTLDKSPWQIWIDIFQKKFNIKKAA